VSVSSSSPLRLPSQRLSPDHSRTRSQGASTAPAAGQPAQFASSPHMGGFSVTFHLPFTREDVFEQLLVKETPLGSSPNCTFTIMRKGYTDGVEVSPGCVRKVTFAAPFFGETVSELTVAETYGEKSRIVWRQLTSSTRLNLLGRDGIPPEYIVELEGGVGGTLVTLRYNFYKADMKGPLFFLVNCMPSLLQYHLYSSIVDVWYMEMVHRGYPPEKKPVFTDLSANMSEEKRIRLKALETAPSHPCARCLGGGA